MPWPLPVYGDYFEGVFDVPIKTPTGPPLLTWRPVVDLPMVDPVAYLTEIQPMEQP